MLIKKSVIRNGFKFDRIYWVASEHIEPICDCCYYNRNSICALNDLCSEIYYITKTEYDSVNYGYVIKKKIERAS